MYCKIFVNDQGDKPTLLNVLAKEFQAESIHINTLLFPARARWSPPPTPSSLAPTARTFASGKKIQKQ